GHPDTDSPVDTRPTFEIMVRTDLMMGGECINLCCGAEVDALRGDEPIELKTAPEGKDSGFVRNFSNVMQSEIVGVRTIVVGIKKDNFIVEKVVEKTVNEIKSTGDLEKPTSQCYAFLFEVLSEM
ncbi:hypothetical protein PENTCL1PPCAC_26089, partial [Pristionchus entomophagus]